MGAVSGAFQISVIVLITAAVLASLLAVWRDDHKWADRHGF